MHSSTSSSEMPETSKYDRALPGKSLGRAALLGFVVMLALMAGWEAFWRANDAVPSYRNSEGLWAIQRRRIDNGEGDKTVFVGSSRIYFNTQLDVWEEKAGERPIQLALEGTTPTPILEELADDEDFTGLLVVGIAPDVFFTDFAYRRSAFQRYHDESPTQWLGQQISMLVEPYLAFYHFDYSLFTVLKRQQWPVREGVYTRTDVRRLATHGKDRATRMWSKVETEPAYAIIAQDIWRQDIDTTDGPDPGFLASIPDKREAVIQRVVEATRKLTARGVEVIFVRSPSDSVYRQGERDYLPRAENWDVLIERTGLLGIHFEDYEELQGFEMPEWSHMTGEAGDRFTAALYDVIERERALRNNGGE